MTQKPAFPSLNDVLREKYRRSFYAFCLDYWHVADPAYGRLIPTEHIKALADHFQALVEGRISRLNIEIGPGMAKSMVMSVLGPAWVWGPANMPWFRFVCSSAKRELTLRDALKFRTLVYSPEYQALYGHLVRPMGDNNKQNYMENTARGFRRTGSVQSGVTGHRGHMVISDDTLDATDAHSDTALEKVERHMKALSSRFILGHNRWLNIGQRLHEKDAGGWCRSKGFESLCLPTEYDPDRHCTTSIGFSDWRTEKGQLLFPQGFTAARVKEAQDDLGPYMYSAQHQQLPVPVDGGIIKPTWLRDRPALSRSGYGAYFYFADTAYTEKEQNDQSGRVVIAIRNDGLGVDLLHAEGYHFELHDLERHLISDAGAWKPVVVGIENKASGITLIQNLRRSPQFPFHIHEINIPAGFNKNARAHAATPFIARGLVGIDWSQPWAQAFKIQLASFPKGTKRDIADAFVHAILYIQEHYVFLTPGQANEQDGLVKEASKPLPVHKHLSDEVPKRPVPKSKPLGLTKKTTRPVRQQVEEPEDDEDDFFAQRIGATGTW